MNSSRISKARDSKTRRRELATKLNVIVMRCCKNYKSNPKECKIGPDSDRCSKCVLSGALDYDLVVTPAKMERIEASRKKLWGEIKET